MGAIESWDWILGNNVMFIIDSNQCLNDLNNVSIYAIFPIRLVSVGCCLLWSTISEPLHLEDVLVDPRVCI